MPSAPGRRTRRVVELARGAGVTCRILPGVTEILLADDVRLTQVREVQVEDLLRRTPVELDLTDEGNYVTGRTVLVTGAGGSIGSELVRQVARLEPKRMVLLGQGENSLHAIQQELLLSVPDLDPSVVVGNVQDPMKMREVMGAFEPEVVFHAAAHKQVPLLEHNPDEAVLNNVGGTRSLAEAALEAGVARFVNISTDKAVNPVSMLGVTKAIAERLVLGVAGRATAGQVFVSVRFGNVLGSRGSVVPVFQDQINRGAPMTVTDPMMTRYFMTIPEASRLVIQAGSFTDNGAVYVLDMGDPVPIVDLARDMIRLSGRDEDEIEIVYSGLRPGEKLAEELFTEAERTTTTRYEQILVARSEPAPAPDLDSRIDLLLEAARRRDWSAMDTELAHLVPGYRMGALGHLRVSPL
jgi:FlaA1/EpsC-like NDP-sugar epimerase